MKKTAEISECGKYRYRLGRQWGPGEPLVFVMLNPSTADAETDDPTIRKCVGFARRLGFDGIEVVNLFAYRATSPDDLWATSAAEREGPDNLAHIRDATEGRTAVLAWGAHARRDPLHAEMVEKIVRTAASRVRILRELDDGVPAHPLMLPYSCVESSDPPCS